MAAEKMAKSSGVMTKHVIESWWPRKTRMSEGAGGWTWAGRARVTVMETERHPYPHVQHLPPSPTPSFLTTLPRRKTEPRSARTRSSPVPSAQVPTA